MELLIKIKMETNDAFWAFRSVRPANRILKAMWWVFHTVRIDPSCANRATDAVISHGYEN
jgi:hypothetical protein